jgi:hypothetical protein
MASVLEASHSAETKVRRYRRAHEQGTLTVAPPWKGNYVIGVEHLDAGQAPPTPAVYTPKR